MFAVNELLAGRLPALGRVFPFLTAFSGSFIAAAAATVLPHYSVYVGTRPEKASEAAEREALLQKKISHATDMAFRIEQMNREFFNALGEFARMQREGQPQSNYAWQSRILPATRTLPYWDEIEVIWDTTVSSIRMLLSALEEIYSGLGELHAEGHEHLQDVMADLGNVARRLGEAEANVTSMVSKPDNRLVYWIEVQPNGNKLALNAAPLSVGDSGREIYLARKAIRDPDLRHPDRPR